MALIDGTRSRGWLVALAAVACMAAALVGPGLASAHHPGGKHWDGRLPGAPDFQRVGKETHQFDPENDRYIVRRPGHEPGFFHVDTVPVGATISSLPANQDDPHCTYNGHRVIPVWSHPAGASTTAISGIRTAIRKMNWRVLTESKVTSGNARSVEMVVECDASGQINVRNLTVASDAYSDSVAAIQQAYGLPTGANSVKYLIFRDGVAPFDDFYQRQVLGLGQIFGDSDKSASDDPNNSAANTNRIQSAWAISWRRSEAGGSFDFWQTDVPLHEMFHNLGAVQPDAPHASENWHCVDGVDLMCYDDDNNDTAPEYSDTFCLLNDFDEDPIDCGANSYFDAIEESGEWLSTHWNTGGWENPFLTRSAPIGIGGQGLGVTSPTAYGVHLYARDSQNWIYRRDDPPGSAGWTPGGWVPFQGPPATIQFDPAAINRSSGSEDVFVVASGQLWHRYWNGSFSAWYQVGTAPASGFNSAPAAVVRPDNGLDVVARATDGKIYQRTYAQTTGWSGWKDLGAPPPGAASSPTTTTRSGVYVDVMVRGGDNTLWHRAYHPSSGWTPWISLGGTLTSAPAAVGTGASVLYAFARWTDNTIRYRVLVPGVGWSAWTSLGGSKISSPVAVSVDNYVVDVYAVGTDNAAWRNRYNNGWSGWSLVQ